MIRRSLTAAALVATATLLTAGPAAAETEEAHRVDMPKSAKVLNKPAKRLSVSQASRARARARRTSRFPAPPRLRVDRSKIEKQTFDHRRRAIEPAEDQTPVRDPGTERLFGNESPYFSKRDPVLGAIQRFNATHVPRNGGTYVAPRLYEVQHGGQMPGCNAAIYNGVYCGLVNQIGWSMGWTADAFRTSGDMKWATLIAHEYGHGAQRWLNIRGGWMNYTLYSEAFADCMAGAFLWHAHASRITDAVGRGDYNEFRDAFVSLASPTTQLNNHGTFSWRYSSAVYGWNYGFDGCVRWARSIDGV